MIYGQSGGGSKVTTLMGIPAAAGLFHRAAAQSGGGGNIPAREQQREVARVMMKDLGLAANDLASLQKMEWSKLIAAGNAAVAKINPPMRGPFGPFAPGPPRVGWSPCVDGSNINLRSFFDAAPEVSKNVPMLIGSVSEESNQMSSRPTEEEWSANLTKAYGEQKASALIAALKKSYPKKGHPHALVYVQRRVGTEHPFDTQQRGENGQAQTRIEGRARLCLLLHLADADAGRNTGCMAHSRLAVLL
jgi:para-nitrobenzyl esterase